MKRRLVGVGLLALLACSLHAAELRHFVGHWAGDNPATGRRAVELQVWHYAGRNALAAVVHHVEAGCVSVLKELGSDTRTSRLREELQAGGERCGPAGTVLLMHREEGQLHWQWIHPERGSERVNLTLVRAPESAAMAEMVRQYMPEGTRNDAPASEIVRNAATHPIFRGLGSNTPGEAEGPGGPGFVDRAVAGPYPDMPEGTTPFNYMAQIPAAQPHALALANVLRLPDLEELPQVLERAADAAREHRLDLPALPALIRDARRLQADAASDPEGVALLKRLQWLYVPFMRLQTATLKAKDPSAQTHYQALVARFTATPFRGELLAFSDRHARLHLALRAEHQWYMGIVERRVDVAAHLRAASAEKVLHMLTAESVQKSGYAVWHFDRLLRGIEAAAMMREGLGEALRPLTCRLVQNERDALSDRCLFDRSDNVFCNKLVSVCE